MARRGEQVIDYADVEYVWDGGNCGRVTKREIRSSIELCTMEKDINVKNLWEYVFKKNAWKGIVIKRVNGTQSCTVCKWSIQYKIDGDDYMFRRFT